MNEKNALLRPGRSGTNKFSFLVRKTHKNDNALTRTHIHAKKQTKEIIMAPQIGYKTLGCLLESHTTTNAKPQSERRTKTNQMFIKGLKDNDRLLRVEAELHYCLTN